MKTSNWAIETIKLLEGYREVPYWDSKGYSVGYGHFLGPKRTVTKTTRQQAEAWLASDIQAREEMLKKILKVPVSQRQFDALVMWGFNFSEHRYKEATFFKRINAGAATSEIVTSWQEWFSPKDSKAIQRNLKHRRQMETDLWTGRSMVRYPVYIWVEAQKKGLPNSVPGTVNPNPDGYDTDENNYQAEQYADNVLPEVLITAPRITPKPKTPPKNKPYAFIAAAIGGLAVAIGLINKSHE